MNKDVPFSLKILNIQNCNQFYLEKIYQDFLRNPNSVSDYWKNIFENYKNFFYNENDLNDSSQTLRDNLKYEKFHILNFIRNYGHNYSQFNPLKNSSMNKKLYEDLLLHKILKNTKKKEFDIQYDDLLKIYCGSIGIEYMYIENFKERIWIQEYLENNFLKFKLKNDKKIDILKGLIKSEIFEKYLNTKFPGSKRFSLEGADVLIPMIKYIINYSSNNYISKIIIGMAHRGRLNVLVNILNKNIKNLCHEFSETYQNFFGSGDAKYHSGMRKKIYFDNQSIDIDLKFNPSHLEIINPVVMGSSKAYIDNLNTKNTNVVLPINIHGDAAIIGQGVNQELLNMSQATHYNVGGTLHIIINNQIGFTTSKIKEMRSSKYCTDIAKMIQAPVFHVNADDPESVIFITKLALDFRLCFKKDVFIDLVCYRRHGHNEADEPYVTQPLMYNIIRNHPTVCRIYSQKLYFHKIICKNFLKNEIKKQRQKINIVKKSINYQNEKKNKSSIIKKNIVTHININTLAQQINIIPKDIKLHDRVHKIYQLRYDMAIEKIHFDWGAAENLAYANILSHGISCRLSGEDVARGTFFHRHAIVYDQNSGKNYIPLQNIKNIKGKFHICNSVLSEEATLAFEYGYSIESHNVLNIWEAQFGDFVNGAQIVIDQFISSSEQKWGVKSNLILFLPHGYEGQGPEHSSARVERFLQLCSENNMQLCIPSTASQMYHLLMKQALSSIIKPLIILTPKSLLRHELSKSSFEDIKNGSFKTVINEIDILNIKSVKKIIFCSGKIYYEILNSRRERNLLNIFLIRIEQLYPFPKKEILKYINNFKNIKYIYWCQEEPKNQGPWYYIYHQFYKILPKSVILKYIGPKSLAASAVGCIFMHKKQHKKIIFEALQIT
ncbi:2-oxoglutarate dehydrogenase E1 component [Buchnera aphidicola]|uniref:2-oxoglutarate dehydrogenase E1 component n=1 Tax=Buchnera aphidicola TaxID=9 RepID=UPI003464C4F3